MASAWQRLIGGGFVLRSLVRELRGIRQQLERQGDLLEAAMLAYGVVAPRTVQDAKPADLVDTGVSYLDGIERGLVEDYIARTRTDTGREPTDQEVETFLADEKTVAMYARIADRVNHLDLERLGSRK